MTLGELLKIEKYLPNQYARAVIILFSLLFVLRIVFYLIEKIALKLTSKTKTEIDDILFEKSSKPLTIIAFLFALRVAIEELSLSESLVLNISRAISSLIVIFVAYLIYMLIDVVFVRSWKKFAVKTKAKLDDTLINLIQGTLRITLVILSILYILDLWGIEIVPLLGALGIAGLAVALALQPILSNIFSGVAMILDKSVRVGDWVILEDGVWGIVDKIGIRSTKLKTFDNELLIIPNSKFSDSRIQNVSMPEPKARIVIPFGVAYGSDVEKVKKIVADEIKKLKNLEENEDISVKFLEMGGSSLNFKVYFYVNSFENRLNTIDEATTRIYDVLNKHKINIPFPQMDIHIKDKK